MDTSVKNQYLATIVANLMSVSYGTSGGWPSASFLVLESEDSPLETGPITKEEVSWIGSIICLGGLIGNIFFGWLADRIGRKLTLCIIALPELASWILIIFAKNVTYLYASRFLCGLAGGGVFVVVPLYVTEISDDRVRGTLGSFLTLTTNVGILSSFILGNFLSYATIPYILTVPPIIFAIVFLYFPETPYHLVNKQKKNDAEKSLIYLRNIKESKECHAAIYLELEQLKSKIGTEDTEKSLKWSDFNNRPAIKAMVIGLSLMALNQFCGIFAMINYAATIFAESGSSLSPTISTIIVGVIMLIGSYFATMLVERAGRKILISGSAFGTSLGLALLGIYTMLQKSGYDLEIFKWVPIFSFSFTVFIASFGVLTLPFLVLTEILPTKIRSFGTCFCMSVQWVFAFTMVKIFPILSPIIGMHGLAFIFSGCSFVGGVFVYLVIPETKGKSLEAITKSLM